TPSTKSHSRSRQMSLDSIEQDNHDSGPNLIINPSQRYVLMDTSDNDSPIVNENGGGNFVYEEDHIYATSSETRKRIFNKITLRMRKKEDETDQTIVTGSDQQ